MTKYLPIDLEKLGISASTSVDFELIRERPTHKVYRLFTGKSRFVLKLFLTNDSTKEVNVYSLLQELAVPTLPVHAMGDSYLLLEDLDASPILRLAKPEDMGRSEVAKAIGEWYRQFHLAGKQYLQKSCRPSFLNDWIDWLDQSSLLSAGKKFDLNRLEAWKMATDNIEFLKENYRFFPQTFNYHDFAVENLALSRCDTKPLRAIVFDYDCLTIGTACSDFRNVFNALEKPAGDSFQETFGPVDTKEKILDKVLSIIDGIVTASNRPNTPKWAIPLIEIIKSGKLVDDITQALTVCKS